MFIFLKINNIKQNVQLKLVVIGVLSLFLVMLVPVYAEITEISIEKNFYTIDEKIVFVGITSYDKQMTECNLASSRYH